MTLLTITQNSARLLGLPVPTEVVDSPDTQVQQLFALANEEGDELSRSFNWQIMTRQHTFETVAAEEQPDAVPDDFDQFIPNTFFNRSTRLQVWGPVTPQMWQAIQAQPQLNRVYLAYRQRDGAFLMSPTPTAGDTIAYEYVSNYWAEASNGDLKAYFTADTDTTVLQERLFVLGIRWRFRKTKQLDYAEDFRTYQIELQKVQASDGGSTQLSITGSGSYNPYGFPNIPLGNFPSG